MQINDNKIHRLSELILSMDIDNHTVISVYDSDSHMIARGNWFEDHILDMTQVWGKATGDREQVNFRMV